MYKLCLPCAITMITDQYTYTTIISIKGRKKILKPAHLIHIQTLEVQVCNFGHFTQFTWLDPSVGFRAKLWEVSSLGLPPYM